MSTPIDKSSTATQHPAPEPHTPKPEPHSTAPVSKPPVEPHPVTPPHRPAPPVLLPEKYTFTLDSFRITNTRSRHEDTDYVSFTLLVKPKTGNGTPQTLKKSMGNLNNGTFAVNLAFKDVEVHPEDTVTMNYLIVNSGHKSESQIFSTLDSTAGKLATAGATAAVGALIGSAIPGLGTALGAVAGWLAGEITGVLDADCDGAVAAEQDTLDYHDLMAKTLKGDFKQETKHPGTDSAHGCGSNSEYYVTWHLKKG